MTAEAIAARLGAALLADEQGRKTLGWVVAAVLAPLILIAAVLCSVGSGGAAHNNAAVRACFYGVAYSSDVPAEYQMHVEDMRDAFALLSSAVSSANEQAEGGTVDLVRVEAAFFALCFGEDAPSRRAADRFAECFYTTETRTRYVKEGTRRKKETYTVTVPLSLEASYANVAALLGREITADDRNNIDYIYAMVENARRAAGEGNGRFEKCTR